MDEINQCLSSKSIKTNCSNTLRKFFYKPEQESVTNLKFIDEINLEKQSILNTKLSCISRENNSKDESKFIRISKINYSYNILNLELPTIIKEFDKIKSLISPPKKPYCCERRIENTSYEVSLEKKRKQIEEKIFEMNEEKREIKNNLKEIIEQINNLNIEVEILSNCDKYYNFTEKIKSKLEKNDSSLILSKKSSYKSGTIKRVKYDYLKKSKEKKNFLLSLIDQKNLLISDLEELKLNLNKVKTDLTDLKNLLLVHYHNLLNEGKDTRSEGLVWIIKAIWALESNVIKSFLPNFLDENSIIYLFNIAKKDTELLKINNQMKTLKKNLSELKTISFQSGDSTIPSTRRDLSKNKDITNSECSSRSRELQNKSKSYIYELTKINFNVSTKDDNQFLKPIDNFKLDHPKNILSDESTKIIKEIKKLEKSEEEITKDMHNLRTNELKRINKEFLINDYTRRFKITQESVISALIGEDLTESEYNILKKEQNDYIQKIINCKTYCLLDKKQ